MIAELFLDDDPVPVGTRVGDLIHGLRVSGADTRSVLRDMRRIVESAHANLANIAQVSFFVAQRDLLPTINPAWLDIFPDEADRPTYKFMTADLPPDRPVHLEFFAVANQRRQMLHLPNVAHTNPIPMGVRIGRYLFSSRVLPYDPTSGQPPLDAAQQTVCVYDNVRALLVRGNLEPTQITQGRLFLADLTNRSLAERHWDSLVAAAPRRSALQVTHYSLAPALRVMLEVIAVA